MKFLGNQYMPLIRKRKCKKGCMCWTCQSELDWKAKNRSSKYRNFLTQVQVDIFTDDGRLKLN